MELGNNDGERPRIARKQNNSELKIDSRHSGASSQEAPGIEEWNKRQDMHVDGPTVQHTGMVDDMDSGSTFLKPILDIDMDMDSDTGKESRLYKFFTQGSTRPLSSDVFKAYFETPRVQRQLESTARGERCHLDFCEVTVQCIVMSLHEILGRCNEESMGLWDRGLLERDALRERVETLGVKEFDGLVAMVADVVTVAPRDQEEWARKLKKLIQDDLFKSPPKKYKCHLEIKNSASQMTRNKTRIV